MMHLNNYSGENLENLSQTNYTRFQRKTKQKKTRELFLDYKSYVMGQQNLLLELIWEQLNCFQYIQ